MYLNTTVISGKKNIRKPYLTKLSAKCELVKVDIPIGM
jgi:hypothetical protein